MKRREFIGLVGGAAIALPLGAFAQEPGRIYRLAVVISSGRDEPPTAAFLDELREQGFVEGKNLEFIPGGFRFDNQQTAAVVPAIVKAAPDAIVVAGDFIAEKFQKETKYIPLVVMTEDMIAAGFAASLAKPGGMHQFDVSRPRRQTAGYSDRGSARRAANRRTRGFKCRNIATSPCFGSHRAVGSRKRVVGGSCCKQQRDHTGRE
ncbi:MAG: hypothetical protein WA732_11330 [Pseudolabrys sp.]